MKPMRPVLDVSELPTVTFGSRSVDWWGTLGFMVIEGMTLAIAVTAYFYLRRNFEHWPPYGTPYPGVVVATIDIGLYLVSIVPLYWLSTVAKRMELGKTRVALVIASLFIIVFSVLRGFEFAAVNVRWDTNAYGSVVWTILGFHATLVLVEAYEVIGMAAIFLSGAWEPKHFSDAADVAFYWYFLVGSWIPLYVLVFLVPRAM